MARSPRMAALRSFGALLRRLQQGGLPFSAADEILSGRTTFIDRRRVLKGLGAGALAVGLPSPAFASNGPTIAIVGGGIAGLSCAFTLKRRGIQATVYEAQNRPGGRMHSNDSSWVDGQVSEWCGELIDTGHVTIRNLAKRFHLPMDDLLAAELPGSSDIYHFFGHYYPTANALSDFAPVFAAISAASAAARYPTTYKRSNKAGRMLDSMSIHDWIEQNVPGGHTSPMGALLDTAYTEEYGADTTDQSSLNLIYLLSDQPVAGGFSIFGLSDERYRIRGGNDLLPKAIANYLGEGSAVLYKHRLVQIALTSSGRVQLTFEIGPATKEVVADIAVLAIPFAVLREIDYSKAGFDALKTRAIQELGRGRSSKLQLQFSARPWRGTGPWGSISNGGSYSDTGYQNSWEVTRGQAGNSGILNFYMGGSAVNTLRGSHAYRTDKDPNVIANAVKVLTQVEPVLPGLAPFWNGRATLSLPHLNPNLRASYSYFRVGQYTDFAGYEGVPQGSIFFCGEHTSRDFQGYMEGGASEGVQTGRQLAKLV